MPGLHHHAHHIGLLDCFFVAGGGCGALLGKVFQHLLVVVAHHKV